MNNINISQKKLHTLEPLELSKHVFNTEGRIYTFDYRGKKRY